MTEETETERLSRECREMYDELFSAGKIEGTYEEWLKHATDKAVAKLTPKRIVVPS